MVKTREEDGISNCISTYIQDGIKFLTMLFKTMRDKQPDLLIMDDFK
jgi:hypothetical protein